MKLAAITVAAILGGLAGWATRVEPPFDPAAWSRADYWRGDRNPMADQLIRSGALVGKTRSEIVAMLGEPPETSYFRGWDMVYILGPERAWMSIDSEWLVLRLADGRVSDARLVRD